MIMFLIFPCARSFRAKDEGFSEACMRAGVKNSASVGLNVLIGEGIGFLGTRFVPTTYGISSV